MRKPVHSAENNTTSHLQFKLGIHSAFQLHFFTFFPWTWHLAVVKQALLISKSGTGTRDACFAADHVLQAAIALGLEFSCLFYKLILAKHVSHSPCLSKSLMSLD